MHDVNAEQPTEQSRRGSTRLKVLGRLAGRMAHEINNALAGIRNASELLRRLGQGDADRQRYAGIIDREAGHIAQVMRCLTDALQDRGSSSCTASVAGVAAEAGLALVDPEGDVRLLVCLDDDAREIEAPEAILRLVMYSMLKCALGESSAGSAVRLRSERGDRAVVLSISTVPGDPPVPVPGVAVDSRSSVSAEGAQMRGIAGFDVSFAADMLELFDGSLTISSSNGGPRSFVSRWPAVPRLMEADRHGG